MNPRLIQLVLKGLGALGALLAGGVAGSKASDEREAHRRRRVVDEERLRHERVRRDRTPST